MIGRTRIRAGRSLREASRFTHKPRLVAEYGMIGSPDRFLITGWDRIEKPRVRVG